MNNLGAQFIQHLMGTYPIIMLGCGNTVSDPNLHGFLSFAEKYLKSDIPYFYIHKEGEDISEIPKNCTPVCYGAEYSDFPAFVQELALIRIQNRADIGIGKFNPYKVKRKLSTPYGRLHFVNLFTSFVGRKDEMEQLNKFLNEPADYSWWVVTGKGGAGKSRMVLEWVRNLPVNWYGIFVDPEKTDLLAEFSLFSNTVFVFDYIIGKEDKISSAISELQKNSTRYKIRILFIERSLESGTKNWLDLITLELSSNDMIDFLEGGYSGTEIVPLTISSSRQDEEKIYISDYLTQYLCECVDEKIKNKYWMCKEETADTIGTLFRTDIQEEFWIPLYLSIFIELWIYHDGNPDIHTGRELLEKYIEKEEDRWKKLLGDEGLLYGYAKALAIACVIDGYCISIPYGYKNSEIGRLHQYIRSKRSPGKKKTDWSQLFIREYSKDEVKELPFVSRPEFFFGGILDGKIFEEEELVIPEYDEYFTIEPEYPELLREYIVYYYIQEAELKQFTKVIRRIDIGRLQSVSFLNHAIEDFPDEIFFQKLLTVRPDNIHEHYVLMKTLILIDHKNWFKSLDDIKTVLLESEYTAYVETDCEVYMWGMLAECLSFLEDSQRLLKYGMEFFDYLNVHWDTPAISYTIPVIRAYSVGFFVLDDLESLIKYTEKMDCFAETAAKYRRADKFVQSSKLFVHYALSKMYFYRHDTKRFEQEFSIMQPIGKRYMKDGYISYIYSDVLWMQIGLWSFQKEISHSEVIHDVTIDFENIYANQQSEHIAVMLSRAYGIEYTKYWSSQKKGQKKIFKKYKGIVKQLLDTYPDNQDILISYILLLCGNIKAQQYDYSMLSNEDWDLFEKLSILRPELIEIMVYYRVGLEYKMDRVKSMSKEEVRWTFRYFDFLMRMAMTFKELEKDPKFTFPRKWSNILEEKNDKNDKLSEKWLSMWKENFTKNVLEIPPYDPNEQSGRGLGE